MAASSESTQKEGTARRRKEQIEFRAPAPWIAEVEQAAQRLCLSVSAFVRLAVSEKLRRLDHDRD